MKTKRMLIVIVFPIASTMLMWVTFGVHSTKRELRLFENWDVVVTRSTVDKVLPLNVLDNSCLNLGIPHEYLFDVVKPNLSEYNGDIELSPFLILLAANRTIVVGVSEVFLQDFIEDSSKQKVNPNLPHGLDSKYVIVGADYASKNSLEEGDILKLSFSKSEVALEVRQLLPPKGLDSDFVVFVPYEYLVSLQQEVSYDIPCSEISVDSFYKHVNDFRIVTEESPEDVLLMSGFVLREIGSTKILQTLVGQFTREKGLRVRPAFSEVVQVPHISDVERMGVRNFD